MRIVLFCILLLAGCSSIRIVGFEYTWTQVREPSDYYRWETVSWEEFPARCGFSLFPGIDDGGGCAIQLRYGIIKEGDVALATGSPYRGPVTAGKLCVVQSTCTEAEARNKPSNHDTRSHRDHELEHCLGRVHEGGRG